MKTPYRFVTRPDGRSVLEHILIAEAALGKRLPAGAQVHHIDGNGLNNQNRNLVICENHAYHSLLDARGAVVFAGGDPNTQLKCTTCYTLKPLAEFNACRKVQSHGKKSICRSCQSASWKQWVAKGRRKSRRELANRLVANA